MPFVHARHFLTVQTIFLSGISLLGIVLGHWEELSWNWCRGYGGDLRLTTERTVTWWFRYAICSCKTFFDSSNNIPFCSFRAAWIFPFFFRLFWLLFFPLSLISWSTPRGAQFAAPATGEKVVTKMGSIYDLRTPAFLVDLKTLKNNCRVMREKCKSLGVQLRTHMKTHRTK